MNLKEDLSAYLDFLRFGAAVAVLLSHMNQDGFSVGWLGLTYFGHEAVIVFFVLSGLIIHYSTTVRATSGRQYAVARISRIYSVALPAVLTFSFAAMAIASADLQRLVTHTSFRALSWTDIASSLLFLNESWMNKATLSLNGPYWSLCYEVWFYVLFGIFMFAQRSWRWPLLALTATIAGPAIIALLPVWLMGSWMSARMNWSSKWASHWAYAGFAFPVMLIIFINQMEFDLQVRTWLKHHIAPMWRLESSQRFLTDYLVAALVVLHIRSFSSLPQRFRNLFLRQRSSLAALAGFSFTLYLFHRPFTIGIGAYWPAGQSETLYSLAAAVSIVLLCWAISFLTEKQLPHWRRGVAKLLSSASPSRTLTP